MVTLWMGPAFAEGPAAPAVVLAWSPRGADATVSPPSGYHLAVDAPARLRVEGPNGGVGWEGDGAALARSVALPPLPDGRIGGVLEVGLCTEDGATCRPTSWRLAGDRPGTRRGSLAVAVAAADALPPRPFGPSASAAPLEEALARARTSGKPVLVDFSAAWCPPCNQLAVDLLEAHHPALAAYEVAILDADHPSSFPAKDRYDVGGYPTVLVVDPDGAERTRLVGYPGLEATVAWLASAGTSDDAALLAAGPAGVDGARAAALAWWLVSGDHAEEARPWLARAVEAGADGADRWLAALALDEDPDALRWLAAHGGARTIDALPAARELAKAAPADVRALCDAARAHAIGSQQADVLELRAETAGPGPERDALLEGAVAVLTSLRTGDPAHDKPNVTWLAALLEQVGRPDDAVALLTAASATWSAEPTYDLALAPLLVRLRRAEEALPVAERAVARAWGDNHLRAVAAQARVLVALGRGPEAAALAGAELAAQPAPAAGTNPRTDRYRAALQKLADGG